MTYTLIPKLWYTITPETDCDIDTPNGISIHLPAGIQYFHFADSVSIDISGTATVTQNPPLFKPASASGLGGGYIESDLNVGHAAADAVAAICTLELGDLGTGGTLTDGTTTLTLEPPHAYATGHVGIADATEAGTITFGTHEAIEFEADAGDRATGWLQVAAGGGQWLINGETFSCPGDYSSVEAWNVALSPLGLVCTDESIEEGSPKVNIAAIEPGTQGNAITLEATSEYAPVSGPTLTGGTDGRSPQDVVDALNDSGDCPAVAVLAHVEAQDAKAVLTPLESYDSSAPYEFAILENGAGVNGWMWYAHDGDTVQELLAALNDDSGTIWGNTRDIEATLEDGKVVLRRLGVHGAASNGYVVQPYAFTPFAESEETPIEGGRDADTITLTAKEYGVNDTITITGGLFENADGMSGGHGDYTIAELLEAIGDEFTDITAAAGAAEGTITLTANAAGKAANAVTYTATGCFGSGTVRQGSTTRGKDAVEQTQYGIFLNGEPLDVEPAPSPTALTPTTAMRNSGVYTVAAGETPLDFSGVTIAPNARAEIRIDCSVTASVVWPAGWKWLPEDGGGAPLLRFARSYVVEVRENGGDVLARVVDEYTPGLPAGYAGTDYVTSAGSLRNYVETDIVPTRDDVWYNEVEQLQDTAVGGWGYYFNPSNAASAGFYSGTSEDVNVLLASLGGTDVEIGPLEEFVGGRHSLKITASSTIEVDGTAVITGASGFVPLKNQHWYATGVYAYSAPRGLAKTRLYGGYIKRGSETLAKWVPCKRVSDGAYCLYDLIAGGVMTTPAGLVFTHE